jgi:hypothetical protein
MFSAANVRGVSWPGLCLCVAVWIDERAGLADGLDELQALAEEQRRDLNELHNITEVRARGWWR